MVNKRIGYTVEDAGQGDETVEELWVLADKNLGEFHGRLQGYSKTPLEGEASAQVLALLLRLVQNITRTFP